MPPLSRHRRYEFSFASLDTRVQVEVARDGVVIRTSRDTFSPRRKEAFIRELAAEGFIPDEYGTAGPANTAVRAQPVRWMVDVSWIELRLSRRERLRAALARLGRGVRRLWRRDR
ncbi:MAG TPA: hypothetical protein VHC86_04590 [Opitutaceae bacterium]|nr:hypothetical protein [Opitutaceae bacterium]